MNIIRTEMIEHALMNSLCRWKRTLVSFLGVFLINPLLVHGNDSVDRAEIVVSDQARAIHQSLPVIDGHNDLPWALRAKGGLIDRYDIAENQPKFDTDIPRLRIGGVGAQFWSVYVPVSTMNRGSALTTTLEQIELVKAMCARYPGTFELALSTEDIERIRGEGKIASLIGVEGGHSIENSLGVLRQLYQQGARYMTLTHSKSLDWADACTDKPISRGLSPFGEEVVREMNRLGMLVDLSHVSPDCMRHALRITTAPVVFSHSSAYAIANHPRNVPDDVLQQTKSNGGVVMINFYTGYVHPDAAARSSQYYAMKLELTDQYPDDEKRVNAELQKWLTANPASVECTVHDVLDHIDHIANLVGVDHVGLGSDFDGVSRLPAQLKDVAAYPVITQGLLDRGYSDADIRKVLGENLMRVFREAEAISRSTK